MIGILIGLAISWLLLFIIEKKSILALGFLPFNYRVRQFFTGFIVAGVLCILSQALGVYLKSSDLVLNETINFNKIIQSLFWDFKSVFTEELIFRGALLYILIRRIGSWKSIVISAIFFGIYHWFSYGVIGNALAMIIVFLGTGLTGLAWAWAFKKTNSMMLPTGLHFGWNFFYNTVFSNGPLGEMILIQQGGAELSQMESLINFLFGMVVVPILMLIFVKNYKIKEVRFKPD